MSVPNLMAIYLLVDEALKTTNLTVALEDKSKHR